MLAGMAADRRHPGRLMMHQADLASAHSGPAVLVQRDLRITLHQATVRNTGTRAAPVWTCSFQCGDAPWPEPGAGMLELPGFLPAPVVVEAASPGAVEVPGGAMLGVTGRLRFTESLPRSALDPRSLRL